MDEQLHDLHAAPAESHWWFEGRRQVVEAAMDEYFGTEASAPPEPRRLLDVGCGGGSMLGMLGTFGAVTGLEMFPDAIESCRERYGDLVNLRLGHVPEDLAGDASFDVISAFDVIEHIDDDLDAVQRIHDTLRPGGLFVSTVPAFPILWGDTDVLSHHKRRYRRKPYEDLLERAGLSVVRTSYFNTWLFPGVAAIRIGRRLVQSDDHVPTPDLAMTSPRIDRILTPLFASERHVVRRHSFPFGVSLLALARRKPT